jgi:hypothetical protein
MADQKITQLTEDTGPSTDDLIVTVDSPEGSPANKKVTLANLIALIYANAPAGYILQVINAQTSSTAYNDTSTLSDTNLSAIITPSSSNNKILILVSQNGCGKETGNTSGQLVLLRGVTDIAHLEESFASNGGTTTNLIGTVSGCYLDSPATTSATTYKTQFKSVGNTARVGVQYNSALSQITLMEIKV